MRTRSPSGRRSRRLAVSLGGTLRGRSPRTVRVLDVSLTGCLLRCGLSLEPGSIHDLEIELGEAPLAVKARVSETSLDGSVEPLAEPQYLVGIEFLPLGAREESRLRGFVEDGLRRGRGRRP